MEDLPDEDERHRSPARPGSAGVGHPGGGRRRERGAGRRMASAARAAPPLRGAGILLSAVLALTMAACGGEGAGPRTFLSIGTGGTGGIYYPLGGALAGRLSVRDSTRQYTAEVTGGSVENVNRVREGQVDLGLTLAITAHQAYNGGGDYEASVSDLRVVAPLYPNVSHVMVPRNSEASSLAEMAGKRISVGSAGSGTEQTSRQILAAYGLDYEDVDEQYLSFSESSAALRDGAIDAAILSVGYPAAAVLEATTTGGVRLLPIDGEARRTLLERHPYYASGTIPAGTYPGVEEAIPTVSMMNWIVGLESLDGAVVTELLDVLRDDRAQLVNVHEMARQIDLSALEGTPIPLHPATGRWLDGSAGATAER